MSFRWRLFASYLLVILLAALLLGLFVAQAMEQRALASLQDNLRAQSALIAEIVAPDFTRGAISPALTEKVRRLDGESGARITLIAPDGRVLADSEHDPATMENHAARPELRQAATSGFGPRDSPQRHPARGHALSRAAGCPRASYDSPFPSTRFRPPMGRFAIASCSSACSRCCWPCSSACASPAASPSPSPTSPVPPPASPTATWRPRAHPQGADELTALAERFNDMAAQLRTTLREVQEEKQKAETILARLGEAVLVTDAAGRITVCNHAAERVFGVTRAQALGRGVVDVTQSPPLDAAFRRALAEGRTTTAELQVLFPLPCALEATVTAIASEEAQGAVAVLHDVTELRRLETVRREFVSNASHELQTPVTAIKAMAETLLAGGRDDPALLERFLSELERQADRLGALVRDLLDLARAEAAAVQPESTALALGELVGEVVQQLNSLAEQRQISVTCELPPDLYVQADWSSLHRVLSNLLDNAIKYTDPGGRIGVRARPLQGRVEVTVWDTGIGMASDALARIFERFYRVDKARSLRLGGTGLRPLHCQAPGRGDGRRRQCAERTGARHRIHPFPPVSRAGKRRRFGEY